MAVAVITEVAVMVVVVVGMVATEMVATAATAVVVVLGGLEDLGAMALSLETISLLLVVTILLRANLAVIVVWVKTQLERFNWWQRVSPSRPGLQFWRWQES
jgi:hypothetical protein